MVGGPGSGGLGNVTDVNVRISGMPCALLCEKIYETVLNCRVRSSPGSPRPLETHNILYKNRLMVPCECQIKAHAEIFLFLNNLG